MHLRCEWRGKYCISPWVKMLFKSYALFFAVQQMICFRCCVDDETLRKSKISAGAQLLLLLHHGDVVNGVERMKSGDVLMY